MTIPTVQCNYSFITLKYSDTLNVLGFRLNIIFNYWRILKLSISNCSLLVKSLSQSWMWWSWILSNPLKTQLRWKLEVVVLLPESCCQVWCQHSGKWLWKQEYIVCVCDLDPRRLKLKCMFLRSGVSVWHEPEGRFTKKIYHTKEIINKGDWSLPPRQSVRAIQSNSE